jgi:hypothetical protein
MKGNYTVTGQSGKDMLKLKSESGGEVTVHKSAVTGLANQASAAPEVQGQRFPVPTQPTPKDSAYPDAHEEVAPVVKGTGVKLDYKIETTKPGVKYPKGRERIIVTRGDRKFYYEIGEKGDRSDYIHPDDQANFRDSGGFEGTKGLIGDPNHPVNNPANHMPEMTGKPFLMHKDDFINYLEGRDYKANINKRKYRDVPKDFSPTHVFRDGRKVQVEINKDQTVARWHAEDGEFGSTALDDFDAVPINKMIGNGSHADMGQIREHLSQFKRNDYVMFTHDGERKAGRILNENTAHNVRIMLMDENLKPIKGDLTLELTDPAVMTLQPSSREAIKGFKGGEVIDLKPKKDIGDVMGNDHANDPQEREIPKKAASEFDKLNAKHNFPDFLSDPSAMSTEELQRKINNIESEKRPAANVRVWHGLAKKELFTRKEKSRSTRISKYWATFAPNLNPASLIPWTSGRNKLPRHSWKPTASTPNLWMTFGRNSATAPRFQPRKIWRRWTASN